VTLRRDPLTMQHVHPEAMGVVPSLSRRRAAASSRNAAKRSKKVPRREMGVLTKRAKQPGDNGGQQRRSPVRTRSQATSTTSKPAAAAGSSHQVRKDETAAEGAKASSAPAPSRGARGPARGPLRPRDPNRRPRTSAAPPAAGPAIRKAHNPLRTDADRANDDDDEEAQLAWLAFNLLFQVQPPPQPRPAKSADDIDKEVRVLVEEKLMHKNYSVKVGALGALAGHLRDGAEGQDDIAEKRLYQRAVFTWDGCHMVLLVLRQELDRRFGGPHRDVVFGAVQFLDRWNRASATHRECTSRLGGVGSLVSAMRAFLRDGQIQAWAIDCLFRFTSDDDNNSDSRERRHELVQSNAALHIGRAMAAHPTDARTHERAVLVLGRLSEFAEYRRFGELWGPDTCAALERVWGAHLGDPDPRAKMLRRTASELVLQMVDSASV
jgi:hypothetical protein